MNFLWEFLGKLFEPILGYFLEHGKHKLHRREEHAEDIKKEVLQPIFDHLQKFYLPVCRMETSPLMVGTKHVYRDNVGSIAEDPYLRTEHCIEITPPASPPLLGMTAVYDYWPNTAEFQRYFNDALQHHYPKILEKWSVFAKEYDAVAVAAKNKAESIIPKLQELIGLPSALAGFRGLEPPCRADYQRLALLVFHRRNGIGGNHRALDFRNEREAGGANILIIIDSSSQRVAWCGGPQEKTRIIGIIDGMIKDATPADTATRKAQFKKLETAAEHILKEIDFCLAEKPRLKKCPFAG